MMPLPTQIDAKSPPARSAAVSEYLDKLKRSGAVPNRAPGARVIFAMDATASRAPTWDRASYVQAEMFEATAGIGGLELQLVFYRGYDECKASRWVTNTADL